MPKLTEIIEMFEQFGFEEAHVRTALGRGDSAFNAFEGLKLTLQLRWGEMCQELSVDRQRELRPIYDRLMKITMKSRTTRADQVQQERCRVANLADDLMDRVEAHKDRNVREVLRLTRERIREMKREGDWSPEADARAKASGIFGQDEEI